MIELFGRKDFYVQAAYMADMNGVLNDAGKSVKLSRDGRPLFEPGTAVAIRLMCDLSTNE